MTNPQDNNTAAAKLSAAIIQTTGHELAQTAAAASEKAMIEAAYTIAQYRKRDIMTARANILEACKRPSFAKASIYSKPIGGKQMTGASIRLAEEMMRCFGNIHVEKYTIFEDDQKRVIKVRATDLEANLSISGEIIVIKTVERRKLPDGMQPLGMRKNTYGDVVYIVPATEDELMVKEAAQVSKLIRNNVLRLIPADIQDDALEQARATMAKKDAEDPKAAIKDLYDAFSAIGVPPDQIVVYLGHNRPQLTPAELAELRAIYTALKSGDATWQEYIDAKMDGRGGEKKTSTVQAAIERTEKQMKTEPEKKVIEEKREPVDDAAHTSSEQAEPPAAQPTQENKPRRRVALGGGLI